MTNKFAAAAAAVAAITDMTKAVKGGGDYAPPAAGPCRIRLVGYVEFGKQKGQDYITKKPTEKPAASFFFEVSGPKHPVKDVDGTKYPAAVIEVKVDISRNEGAKYFKLFQLLNYKGTATHPAQLLGEGFKATLIHRKYKKAGEPADDATKWTGIAAELWDKATKSFKVEPPRTLDEETGEYNLVQVAPALTDLKCFLWDHPDMEQWASIFIDGEYAAEEAKDGKPAREARSKNVLQNKIKAAVNYAGSPIDVLLGTGGKGLDLNVVDEDDAPWDGEEQPAAGQPATDAPDPLAGVA